MNVKPQEAAAKAAGSAPVRRAARPSAPRRRASAGSKAAQKVARGSGGAASATASGAKGKEQSVATEREQSKEASQDQSEAASKDQSLAASGDARKDQSKAVGKDGNKAARNVAGKDQSGAAGKNPSTAVSTDQSSAAGKDQSEAVELPDDLRAELDSLPLRQRLFVAEYLGNGFNASRAARAAGYSESTAAKQSTRLTRNPKLARIVADQAQKEMARREITAERVLEEMAKLAFFDPRRIFDVNGGLLPPSQMGDEEAAAIAGLDLRQMQDGSEMKKIKLADKLKSLEVLGRYLRLFTERVEHSGTLGVQLIHDVPRPER